MDQITENDLDTIARQFHSCVPLQDISWKVNPNIIYFSNYFVLLQNLLDELSKNYELQQIFINKTVNSELNSKYPTKITYQVAFLKDIISELVKQNADIHDDIYSAYGRLMATPWQENYTYKHYFLKNFNYVILKESVSLISDGTTGLRTWQVH